jgi:hypothetical protein
MVALGIDFPAKLVEAVDQDVAAGFVICNDFGYTFLRAVEGGDGGDLDGGEGAVVEVALDAAERGDELLVADHEADAPAGHVVALGEGEELDGDVLGAGDFEDGGRAVAVEDQVGVGEVVDDVDAEVLAQRDQALEEGEVHALGGGVGGEVEDEQLGARVHAREFALEGGDEGGLVGVVERDALDLGAGDDRAEDVDGVAGIGDGDGVLDRRAWRGRGGRCPLWSRW